MHLSKIETGSETIFEESYHKRIVRILLKCFNILDSTNVKVITSKHFMIDHMVVIYLLRILKQILQRFLLSLNDDGNSNSSEDGKLNYN